MADVALVFQSKRTRLDTLELTATLSEGHSRTADVTDHPLEVGSDASDGVRVKPAVVKLEGIVSDSAAPDGTRPATTTSDAFSKLERLLEAGEPITIVTSLREYTRMVMTSLDFPRDAKMGGALRFTASFKQVKVVQTQTVAIRTVTKTPRGKPKEAGGKKAGDPAPEPVQKKSILYNLKENVSGFFGGGDSSSTPKKFVQR